MARSIQVVKVGGWVYLDDDNTVKPVDKPENAPADATAFLIKPVPVDSSLYMAIATGTKDRVEAIGMMLRSCLGDWRNLQTPEGDEVAFDSSLIDALPLDVLIALGGHVRKQLQSKQRDEAQRRGNGLSGTSRTAKRSGGARTRGSRTASPATD